MEGYSALIATKRFRQTKLTPQKAESKAIGEESKQYAAHTSNAGVGSFEDNSHAVVWGRFATFDGGSYIFVAFGASDDNAIHKFPSSLQLNVIYGGNKVLGSEGNAFKPWNPFDLEVALWQKVSGLFVVHQ